MFQWFNRWRNHRQHEKRMRRLDRAELQAAINSLDRTRNNIEELMRRMLEERSA